MQQSTEWIDRQRGKIERSVKELASELDDKPWCNGEAYTLADIAAGCALAYLDLRHPDVGWRSGYPNLLKLADKLAKRPSFQDSAPPASV